MPKGKWKIFKCIVYLNNIITRLIRKQICKLGSISGVKSYASTAGILGIYSMPENLNEVVFLGVQSWVIIAHFSSFARPSST